MNCPKDSEITVGKWLGQIGADSEFVGRSAEGPPDYKIKYRGNKIAVEATLMHDLEGWEKRKEIAFGIELKNLIHEVAREGVNASTWHSTCEYDSRVPNPPNRHDDAWKKLARDAVRSAPPTGCEIQLMPENKMLGRGVVLTLMPENQEFFAGVSVDEGCVVAETISDRLASIIKDKSCKVNRGKRAKEFAQWWLVVDDEVLRAPLETLTSEERCDIRRRVRTCDGITTWSKVILVSRFLPKNDRCQRLWFYAPWEDPRHPSLPSNSSSSVDRNACYGHTS